jgi:hypothetical protein
MKQSKNNCPELRNSKYADKILAFYENSYETIIETAKGYFLVQSPDLQFDYEFLGSGYSLSGCGFELIDRDLCWDLRIPDEIFE